jgi:hypothetical protein
MRRDITYPDMVKEVLPRVVRFIRPAPGMSTVLYSDLTEANADAEIKAQIDFFTAKQLLFTWKLYAYDSPPDLLARLQAHGFTPDLPDALMVLDLTEAQPPYSSLPLLIYAVLTKISYQMWSPLWNRSGAATSTGFIPALAHTCQSRVT